MAMKSGPTERQIDSEHRAFADFTFNIDCTTMGCDNLFDDVESEACALFSTGGFDADLREFLKEMWNFRVGNALTLIAHTDDD